jgi:hypothetical protein
MEKDKSKNWFLRHKIISGILIFIILMIIIGSNSEGSKKSFEQGKQDALQKQTSEVTPSEEVVSTISPTETIKDARTEREKVIEVLKANALKEWGDDYNMVKYELDKQTSAYDWIIKQTEYPEIMEKAKKEWGDDYNMVKYEYEKQVKAYKSL